MCFERLYEAFNKDELLLIDGGMCHWHLRNDGQLTIREIFSTRSGAGKEMLSILLSKNPKSIVAKCPTDLESNKWYMKNGFVLVNTEATKTGRTVNTWKIELE